MRGLVATPFITISRQLSSHRAAQGVIYADQLQQAGYNVKVNMTGDQYVDNFNDYQELFVYHGNDFSGAVNLFGGLDNFPYIDNFVNFSRFAGKVYSLVIDFPDYYGIMKEKFDKAKEKGKSWNPAWDGIDWNNLKRMCETAETIIPNDLVKYPRLAIGDSHAICMYRPQWQNLSVPFKTLHGALKEGLDSFIHNKDVNYEWIEFYFGNIDVRHHLCRQEDPIKATNELVDKYIEQARGIAEKYRCSVCLYELLPIENESRSIPKTGWYKGTPFYGSWEERNEVRKAFRERLKMHEDFTVGERIFVYEWIGAMINSNGELDFDCMEKPQSVHLSRKWYPHWQGYEWSHAPYIDYTPIPERELNNLESFFA
jgi:hypothetical protein